VRFGADGLHFSLGGVEGNDRRLVEDNAAPLGEDAGVGGAEVDGEVAGEHGKDAHMLVLRPPHDPFHFAVREMLTITSLTWPPHYTIDAASRFCNCAAA
jgi:hypothetical protein